MVPDIETIEGYVVDILILASCSIQSYQDEVPLLSVPLARLRKTFCTRLPGDHPSKVIHWIVMSGKCNKVPNLFHSLKHSEITS